MMMTTSSSGFSARITVAVRRTAMKSQRYEVRNSPKGPPEGCP